MEPLEHPPKGLIWDQSSLQPGAAGPAAALGGAAGAARMLSVSGMDEYSTRASAHFAAKVRAKSRRNHL